MWIKIRDFDNFWKDESTESKITKFGSRFAEKSSNEQERNFLKIKSRKTEIDIEIDSNYYSKLKLKLTQIIIQN